MSVKVLSRLFRRLFLEGLAKLHKAGKLALFSYLSNLVDPDVFASHLAPLRKTNWVVYAKQPFGGPPSRVGLPKPLHASDRDLEPPPG